MPISAPRSFSPGEVIYSEAPFARVLLDIHTNDLCQSCCRSFSKLRLCKQCLTVRYCGQTCQKEDWKFHRVECKQMVKMLDKANYDIVRLIGRVCLKIKNKDWKHFKTTVLGTEVSFDEIDPHYKEMTENPLLNLMYKEVKEDLTRLIGVENMPKDMDCLKVVGKVVSNTYLDIDENASSLCFFIGISKFKAECIANSSFVISKHGLKIWANKNIEKLADEITIPKQRFFRGPTLISFLDGAAKEPCKCDDCSLPYGASVLTRILDEKRAFSVIMKAESILKLAEIVPHNALLDLGIKLEDLLKDHSGVLGRTNALHLKLMAFRYLTIGGRAEEIKDGLEDLETIMRSVFGEFYTEMLQIYRSLTVVYIHLLHPFKAKMYMRKVEILESLLYSS